MWKARVREATVSALFSPAFGRKADVGRFVQGEGHWVGVGRLPCLLVCKCFHRIAKSTS